MRNMLTKASGLAMAAAVAGAMALGGCVTAPLSDDLGYAPPSPASPASGWRENYSGGGKNDDRGYGSPPRRSGYESQPANGIAAYYWIDQADGFANAIGSAPPDYNFRFARGDAWAWIGLSGETLLMETTADGTIQYYFEPRSATPYLIRDGYRSYGFDGRYLVAIYDNRGNLIGDGRRERDSYDAQQLQRRGRDILSASQRRNWDGRTARYWADSFGFDYIINSGWAGGWRNQPGWYDYDRSFESRRHYRRLDEELYWRRHYRDQFRDWHRHGGGNAPPNMAEPPHTQPVLGDPAGPIMSIDGSASEGRTGEGSGRRNIGDSPSRGGILDRERGGRDVMNQPDRQIGVIGLPRSDTAVVNQDGTISEAPRRGRRSTVEEPGELLSMRTGNDNSHQTPASAPDIDQQPEQLRPERQSQRQRQVQEQRWQDEKPRAAAIEGQRRQAIDQARQHPRVPDFRGQEQAPEQQRRGREPTMIEQDRQPQHRQEPQQEYRQPQQRQEPQQEHRQQHQAPAEVRAAPSEAAEQYSRPRNTSPDHDNEHPD